MSLESIILNHGAKMTGGEIINGTQQPVTAFPTDGLMGIVIAINEILSGILGIFGGGGIN